MAASKDKKAEIESEFEPLREIDDKTLLGRFYRDADDDALAAFVARHRAWAFSIWASDDGRFIGFGDEQESYVAAEDEATARAFIAARRSR